MHTELQKWSAGRLLILSCYCWQHCRSVMSGLTPESLECLKAVISMCVLLHSVLPLQLLLYLQPCFFFFFWHLADIKGQPILLVVLQWLYIDVCMFIWYVIFLSINLWLFQVTLLSWKLVYQRTLVRLLRQCFHIVLSSCSIWMCYNDSWAELKKKKRSKLWFPNGYIGDVMKQGVVSLLAQLMSQRRCKHNSLTLMQNRTTQTKNAWKGSLGSNPFPLWSGWYATQPTQPPEKKK